MGSEYSRVLDHFYRDEWRRIRYENLLLTSSDGRELVGSKRGIYGVAGIWGGAGWRGVPSLPHPSAVRLWLPAIGRRIAWSAASMQHANSWGSSLLPFC